MHKFSIINVILCLFLFSTLCAKELKTSDKDAVVRILGHYIDILEKNPSDIELVKAIGKTYYTLGDYDQAVPYLLIVSLLEPDNKNIKIKLARSFLHLKFLDKSQKLLLELYGKYKNDPAVLSLLGQVEFEKGNDEKGLGYIKKSLLINPKNITALDLLGENYLKKHKYNKALIIFRRIQNLDSEIKWVESKLMLAKYGPEFDKLDHLIKEGEVLQGKESYDKLILSEPMLNYFYNYPNHILEYAKKLEKKRKHSEAISLYKKSISVFPYITPFYENLGEVYIRNKKYNEAITLYHQALKKLPFYSNFHIELGNTYLSQKKYNEASEQFKLVLKNQLFNSKAEIGLAYIEQAIGNKNEAEKLYRISIKHNPKSMSPYLGLGNFLLKENRYKEAEIQFETALNVTNKKATYRKPWLKEYIKEAKLGIVQAKNGPELNEIEELVENGQTDEAIKKYKRLIDKNPETSFLYLQLGALYKDLKEYKKSLDIYEKGLKEDPKNQNFPVEIAFVYIEMKRYKESHQIFARWLEKDPENLDALTGLAKIEQAKDNIPESVMLYKQVLDNDPNNSRALSLFAQLLLNKKDYDQSQEIFSRILKNNRDAKWAKLGLLSAKYGPQVDRVKELQNKKKYKEALSIVNDLIESRPDNVDYYTISAGLHRGLKQYDDAIKILLRALEIRPHALFLWNAIGNILIDKKDYSASYCIFLYVIEQKPNNPDAWAGLGRIWFLKGYPYIAEQYNEYAIELSQSSSGQNPSITPKVNLAELYAFSGFHFSASDIYYNLVKEHPEEQWLQDAFDLAYRDTRPYVGIKGTYYEEDEFSALLNKFDVRYQIYGVHLDAISPLNDSVTLLADASRQYHKLKQLIDKSTLYALEIGRVHLGLSKIINYYFRVEGKLGFSQYGPTQPAEFEGQSKALFEPSLNLFYSTQKDSAVFGFNTESLLVARNFEKNLSKIVGRYFIIGSYQKNIGKEYASGIEATGSVYEDYVKNFSQKAHFWFATTPSCFNDYLTLRYILGYGRFKKVIPDYFTYKWRVTNEIQMTLQKTWQDYLFTSISYLHGWEARKTRFAQIIPTFPFVLNQAFFIDRRQYNMVTTDIDYNNNKFRVKANAFYYRDTTKYTIWSVSLTLGRYF